MTCNHIILLLIIATTSSIIKAEEVPNFLHICHKNDVKLTACMTESIETLKPYLAQGIPELEIAPLEPFELGDLIVAEKTPGQGLSITAREIKAFGGSNFILKSIDVVDYARLYTVELQFPHLYVEGKYAMDGQVVFLPVKGNGRFTGNFTNGSGSVKIKTEVVNENHVSVAKLDIKIKLQTGRINLDNLFGGDKVLGGIVNEAINQNFDLFIRDIIPLIEKSLAKKFRKVGNKIIERYTEEQLFP